MNLHHFLFNEGLWIGEGTIALATSFETIRFFSRWKLVDQTANGFIWLQEVELHALKETNRNVVMITDIKDENFQISIESETLGKAVGKGIITPETISWELHTDCEGIERYQLQDNGTYIFQAEYSSPPYRTTITGKIWKKE